MAYRLDKFVMEHFYEIQDRKTAGRFQWANRRCMEYNGAGNPTADNAWFVKHYKLYQ